MDRNDSAEFTDALDRHDVTGVGRVYTYSGHVESHGEVTFQVKDLGGIPRWSVQVFNEAGVWMGGDVQDSLSVAVKEVLNQPGLGRRPW